jgi:hypothetical protein
MGLDSIMYQLSIEYFWPLTEQIPLDLDYTDSEKPKLFDSVGYSITGGTGASWVTTSTEITTATLKVSKPDDICGYLEIGGLQIGQEKEPNNIQKLIFKLLGFNWKDK